MGEDKKRSIMSMGGRSPDTYSLDDREADRDLDFDDEDEEEEIKSEPAAVSEPAEQEVAMAITPP